jgi:two-component system, NarL family, invasion response regulator UvrY
MIRVLVADDHAVVRAGITRIVREQDDFSVVGEASSVAEVMNACEHVECEVVLLDVNMQGQTSLEALKTIKGRKPAVAILVLSMYPEEKYAVRFLKAGASGYLTKEAAPDELVAAIRKVAAGEHYLTAQLAEAVVFGGSLDRQSPHRELSDREYEVFLGLARGKRIRDLANELSLSEKTISTYRTRVLRKLACATNADLVGYAMQNELL